MSSDAQSDESVAPLRAESRSELRMKAALGGVCPICSTTVPGTQVAPTPERERGMFRKRGTTLLDQCIYLMENLLMESLNGRLCDIEDDRCATCQGHWKTLRDLMDRYDRGER